MSNPTPLYDDAAFFDGYARLRENPLSANEILDIPTIKSVLPPVNGLRMLDLGCGTGGVCRDLIQAGAASVVGVDVSARMLQTAQQAGDFDGRIAYVQSGIEDYDTPDKTFDVIVSSLALHYINDIQSILGRAYRWLSDGGTLVFSVEHPMTTACLPPYEGWERDSENRRVALRVNHYFDEGERVRTWIVDGVTTYHRTVSTYLNCLVKTGFSIAQVVEPTVTPDFVRAHPSYQSERERPLFLCIKAQKVPMER